MKRKPRVWVVDDDADVRGALSLLLRAAKLDAVPCASGSELLERIDPDVPGCILLDLRMPGMGGLEVQRELARRKVPHPIVFLSGHGDIPIAVRAARAGALDFLEKPVRGQKLVAAVSGALEIDRKRREVDRRTKKEKALVDSMSPREAQVAELVADGLRTTQIAEKLGLSTRTVEMHRARLLRRVGAKTSAEAASILRRARAAEAAAEIGPTRRRSPRGRRDRR